MPRCVEFDEDELPADDVDIYACLHIMGINLVPPTDTAKSIVAGSLVKRPIKGGVILTNDEIVMFPRTGDLFPFPSMTDSEKTPDAWKPLWLADHVLWNHTELGQAFRTAVQTYALPAPAYSTDENLFGEIIGKMGQRGYRYATLYGAGLGCFSTFIPVDVAWQYDETSNEFDAVYYHFKLFHERAWWVRDRSFPRAGTLAALIALGIISQDDDDAS